MLKIYLILKFNSAKIQFFLLAESKRQQHRNKIKKNVTLQVYTIVIISLSVN